MRILLINVTCQKGSTGKIVYDLYTEYREAGHQAAICYGRGAVIDEPDILKFTKGWEVNLHALSTRLTGWVGKGSRVATWRLIRYIESFQPDVVHLHNIHGYYVDAYRLLGYLKGSGIPVVFTMHDEWAFTGKCGYSYDCTRWQEDCGHCPQRSDYPKSLLFSYAKQELKIKQELFQGWGNIVFSPVAEWLGQKAASSPVLRGHRFQTVYNGINLDVFRPRPGEDLLRLHHLEGRKVLLHVTPDFADPRKGGSYVLDLAHRMEEDNIAVIIVGTKDNKGDVPSNLILIPRTENQGELAAYYSLADLFLMTSEMECLPTVCLESICCGTPVVGFDGGGAGEATPSGYGLFVPFGDMDGLEAVVWSVLSGGTALAETEQCAAYGRRVYGKATMAGRYLELYGAVVS